MEAITTLSRKKLLLLISLAVVLLIAITTFGYFNPRVGFAYYEPSYLPPNVSIKERRISVDSYAPTHVEQDFRTVDWVYEIAEFKASSNLSLGSTQQNYDPTSVKPTCNILTSPHGQRYRLCHWIDYGRIDVHEVKFIKNGTYVISDIPTSLNQQITIPEIDKYVDSFKPASTLFMPVLRTNGA